MSQLKATISIHGKIECVTGLHIGGSGGGYEIGGVENSVIRNPVDGFPYIPGSSLRGKMRSLMEWAEGKISSDGSVWHVNDPNDVIIRLFGTAAGMEDRQKRKENKMGPSRLIVRDATPDAKTREMMEELEATQGLPKVEIKTEVNINRITSKPISGPRSMERVPVGSRFDFEIVFGIYEVDGLKVRDVDLLDKVFEALRLVEDSALGGSGSRGSGQVQFRLGNPIVRTVDDYKLGVKKEKTPDGAGKLMPLSEFSSEKIEELKKEIEKLAADQGEAAAASDSEIAAAESQDEIQPQPSQPETEQ